MPAVVASTGWLPRASPRWLPDLGRLFAVAVAPAQKVPSTEPIGDAVDEASLVRRASGGDERAMRAIYDHHVPLVKGKLSAVLGPVSDVDDLIQLTFVRAFRNLDKFRGDSRLSTWICRIALNQAYNHLRSRRARARFETAEDERVALVPDRSSAVDERVEERRRLQRLYALLAEVKPKARIAFVLTEVEGHTLDEAAELLGISRNTVAARVRRTRERILRALQRGQR